MRLAQMITEVGYETDRYGSTDRIKFWIERACADIYDLLPKRRLQIATTLTTVSGQDYLAVPLDFGDIDAIFNSTKEGLRYSNKDDFFAPNRLNASGTPTDYTYWDNKIYFSPVPNAAVSFTMRYTAEIPNIYNHDLTIRHNASMSTGVVVYVDEDGVASGEGKLLFVSPTTTDAKILIQAADGHQHEITVYHDVDAATKGVAWYFDETATNDYESNFFISPTKADTLIRTTDFNKHHHFLKFIHNPSPTTYPDANNVVVYLDEDYATRDQRFLFISPTTTNGTDQTVNTIDDTLPGVMERYSGIVYELAVSKGHKFNRNYEWAAYHEKSAMQQLSLIIGNPTRIEQETKEK